MIIQLLVSLASVLSLVTSSAVSTAASDSEMVPTRLSPSYPVGIAAGPDGALWFTENDGIGRITLDGRASLFHVPGMVQMSAATASSLADCYCYSGIVRGPDDSLYFAQTHAIGRMTARRLSALPIRPDLSPPRYLMVGPDRALWFVVAPSRNSGSERWVGDYIVRMSLDGRITWYHPRPALLVQGMATGMDGDVWLTVARPHGIIRMSTHGRIIAKYGIHGTACSSECMPFGITAGPDGNMWFTAAWRVIGRVSPTGRIALFALARHRLLLQPFALHAGPDGRLWFSEVVADQIGAIATDGRAQEYSVPGAAEEISPGISAGGDHNMWFTQTCASNIGRVTPTGKVTSYHIPGTSRTRDSWCPYFMP